MSPSPAPTLATEILDVSDDIAYAVHDFEDGVWSGMIPLHDLLQRDEARAPLIERLVGTGKPFARENDRVTVYERDGSLHSTIPVEGLSSLLHQI